MKVRRMRAALISAAMLSLLMGGPAVGRTPVDGPEFIFQDVELPPFDQSTTYLVVGQLTMEGCVYTYPDFVVPSGIDRWQVRDVGVDPKRCIKLVEEGVPPEEEIAAGDAAIAEPVHQEAAPTGADHAIAAVTSASGYSHAWFENFLGQTMTSDKTWVTWAYNGSCVVDGGASGDWTWNTVYWSHVSHGGTGNLTCSRYFGDTWSTFHATGKPNNCYHYFYHVRAYGWWDGGFTASRSDSATCGPIWEHFDWRRVT